MCVCYYCIERVKKESTCNPGEDYSLRRIIMLVKLDSLWISLFPERVPHKPISGQLFHPSWDLSVLQYRGGCRGGVPSKLIT